jgi:hypothetical protein
VDGVLGKAPLVTTTDEPPASIPLISKSSELFTKVNVPIQAVVVVVVVGGAVVVVDVVDDVLVDVVLVLLVDVVVVVVQLVIYTINPPITWNTVLTD